MMKPNVGLTVLTSSPKIFLTIVVFPALSKPLYSSCKHMLASLLHVTYSIRIRISLSLRRAFLNIDNIMANM